MATASPMSSLTVDAVPEGPPSKGGHRRELFDKKEDQDKFSCAYCNKIVREPVQHPHCGHRFCSSCQKEIEETTKTGTPVLCKSCKEEGCSDQESQLDPTKMFPDKGIKREMSNISSKCPNEPCQWKGLFKEYVSHEQSCQYQPAVCDKCGQLVSKMKLVQHSSRDCPQRSVKCQHCHTDMAFVQKEPHLKECQKVPETCNQCNKAIPKDQMKKHKGRDCPQRTVSCPVDGCNEKQPQHRFQQHVQKDQPRHLSWLLARIADLEDSLSSLVETDSAGGASASSRSEPSPALLQGLEVLKGKVDQLEQQIAAVARKGASSSSASVEGATNGGATADGGATAGGATSVERVNAMEFKVNSLEPILSVLHGEMNRCIGAIEALEAKLQQESAAAREFRVKTEQYERTINTLSSSLTTRFAKLKELEDRLGSFNQDRPDGTLLWKISNFSQVRQDAIAGNMSNIHSRPFYTGPLGYKMCVRLYPNGDGMGKGTHLSLFFTLMRSPSDALLSWPFKQKVYFMLIDQSFKKHVVDAFRSEPNSSSFQRPSSEMNIATGCPLFMQLNKLSQPGNGYLKDDTLFIRVVVETDGIEDHLRQFDPRRENISSTTGSG